MDTSTINAERAEARNLRLAWVESDDKRQKLQQEIDRIKAVLREYLALSSLDGRPERPERQKLRAKLKTLCG